MVYQRITNSYMNESILRNLLMNRGNLVELQKQISSGKRIERTSDDVFSAMSVLISNSSLGKIESYLKNVENSRSELETTDKAIQTAIDDLHKTRELTIQALNATSGPDQLKIIGNQIDQLLQQIKDVGNTKYGSIYFCGAKYFYCTFYNSSYRRNSIYRIS